MLTRRRFLGTLSVGLFAAPVAVEAQPAGKIPRVAFIATGSPQGSPPIDAFRNALRDLGYVEGQNVIIEWRWGPTERFPEFASDVVARGVDVILASNPYAVEAAAKATKTTPIVGVDFESDPVAKGWVVTLARPGHNVTGFFLDIPEMSGKQLQLLKEVKPNLAQVAVIGDVRVNEPQFRATEAAAGGTGLMLQPLAVTSVREIPGGVAKVTRQGTGALLVLSSPMIFTGMTAIAEAALKHRLPTINLFVPFFAEAGGLLAYGPDFVDPFQRAASYVDRIIKGAKPADLPVQRPSKFKFVINLKTAKALNLTIPPSLLLRADQLIE